MEIGVQCRKRPVCCLLSLLAICREYRHQCRLSNAVEMDLRKTSRCVGDFGLAENFKKSAVHIQGDFAGGLRLQGAIDFPDVVKAFHKRCGSLDFIAFPEVLAPVLNSFHHGGVTGVVDHEVRPKFGLVVALDLLRLAVFVCVYQRE